MILFLYTTSEILQLELVQCYAVCSVSKSALVATDDIPNSAVQKIILYGQYNQTILLHHSLVLYPNSIFDVVYC